MSALVLSMDGARVPGALVALLLLGACAATAVPRAARILSMLTLAGAVVVASALLAAVAEQGTLRHAAGGWPAPIGIELAADGIGSVTALATVAVMLACSLASGARSLSPFFWILWTWTAVALVVLFLTADLFNAYVALELVGLCAAGLAALGGGPAAIVAATRYLLVGLVAAALYLLGVAVVYGETGLLDLGPALAGLGDDRVAGLALGLMTAGLLMKSAVFPFHGWLPPAHANAPAAASAVLSGLVLKGAVVLAWRIWDAAPAGAAGNVVVPALGALALGAIAWAGVQAFRAARLKEILAYSTVAQVGFLTLVLAMLAGGEQAALGPGLLLLVVHTVAKAAAFCAAGLVIARLGSDRLDDLGGMGARMPVTTLALGIAAVALVGLPPSGSFVAKWELLSLAAAGGQWSWAAGIVVGTLLPAVYLLRPLSAAFTGVGADVARVDERGVVVPLALALASFALIFVAGDLFALVGRTVGTP